MRWHPSIASQPNASGVNRPAEVNVREVADVPSTAAKVRIVRRRAFATGLYPIPVETLGTDICL